MRMCSLKLFICVFVVSKQYFSIELDIDTGERSCCLASQSKPVKDTLLLLVVESIEIANFNHKNYCILGLEVIEQCLKVGIQRFK